MLQYLTYIFERYFIYNTDTKTIKLYTSNQMRQLLKQGKCIQGLGVLNNSYIQTSPIADVDLGDVAFTTKFDNPTLILKTAVRLPKLPVSLRVYYKGVVLVVKEFFGNAHSDKLLTPHHLIGRCMDIDYQDRKSGKFTPNNISLTEYLARVQELLSCLTYDEQLSYYSVHLFSNQTDLDLSEINKTFRIGKVKITPEYRLHLVQTPVKILTLGKFEFRDMDKEEIRAADLFWVDAIKWGSQRNLTEQQLQWLYEFSLKHLSLHGILVFKNMPKYKLEYFVRLLEQQDLPLDLIKIKQFKCKDYTEFTQQVKTYQGSYKFLHQGRLVLIVNWITR